MTMRNGERTSYKGANINRRVGSLQILHEKAGYDCRQRSALHPSSTRRPAYRFQLLRRKSPVVDAAEDPWHRHRLRS